MFTLEDLLSEASCAEGAQMAQLTTPDGVLDKKKVNKLIPIVNSALDEIYKRFVVRNTYIRVLTLKGVRDYTISPEFTSINSNDPYILDDDFDVPVVAITSIADTCGRNIPLNKSSKQDVIQAHDISNVRYGVSNVDLVHRKFSTPKYNVLRVPQDLEPTELILGVRVAHKRIELFDPSELPNADLSSIEIDLPVTYRTAMIYYLFARIMNAKGASSIGRSMYHEGDGYYGKFLKECDSLKQSDSEVNEQIDYANCFKRTGFY